MLRHSFPHRLLLPVLAFGVLALSGCGTSGVPVKGKLVLPSGYTLQETDSVQVNFQPDSGKGKAATATVNAKDGTFDLVSGGAAKGVAPGKYKVIVQITPYAGMTDSIKRASAFESLNRKYDQAASTLTYEVTAGAPQEITIDLAKGAVTKN
jgi:hypothetical protein